jgi:tetratricopeptide (TPR) repeat protein
MESIRNEIERLISLGLLESAESLCSLYMSCGMGNVNIPAINELYGDCLYVKKEYRRAIEKFRLALKLNANPSRTVVIENADDARIKFKECQCLLQMEDATTAMRELESIPVNLRDTSINTTLGKLYRDSGLRRHAITSFKEVIRVTPTALECIRSVIALGVTSDEIISLIEPTSDDTYKDAFVSIWLPSIIRALVYSRDSQFEGKLLTLSLCQSNTILYCTIIFLLFC